MTLDACLNSIPAVSTLSQQIQESISSILTPSPLNLEIDIIINALKTENFSQAKTDFKGKLEAMDASEIKILLDTLAQQACNQILTADPFEVLDRILNLMTLEQVEAAVKIKCGNYESALKIAKEMLIEAQLVIENTEKKEVSPGIIAKIKEMFNSILIVLDTLLAGFGLSDLFTQSDNDSHANLKIQKILMLITLLSTLTSLLVVVIGGSWIAAAVTGGLFILLIVLAAVYIKFLKPSPIEIPNGVNLSDQVSKGFIPHIDGRKKTKDQLAAALIESKKTKHHPMLTGATNVGKTATVKSLARDIVEGRYPELKGKTVFYFNVADLLASSEGLWCDNDKKLKKISEEMGRNKENVILILDNIHYAFPDGYQPHLANQLKYFLEAGEFPYLISITREESDFINKALGDASFCKHFNKIKMENTTKEETIAILYKYLLRKAPQTLIEPFEKEGKVHDIIEYIYNVSNGFTTTKANLTQPSAALNILAKCLHRIENEPLSKTDKAEVIQDKMQTLILECAFSVKGKSKNLEEAAKQQIELNDVDTQLQMQQQELQSLLKSKEVLAQVKTNLYKTILKVNAAGAKSSAEKDELPLKRLAVLKYFFQEDLGNLVKAEAEKKGMHLLLTKKLVDEVMFDIKLSTESAQTAT
jgi:hypothetical protein